MLENKTQKTAILVACFWSLVLFFSLCVGIQQEYQSADSQAIVVARANLDRDKAIRQWVSKRGGLYARISEVIQASPHLAHLPFRDIQTPVGEMTLLNPAYMLRSIMEEHESLYGIKGRIVGLKALRLENTADDWEKKALGQFKADTELEEYVEIDEISGTSYVRMMTPLYMKPDCMKCHAVLGYQVGELQGGVNVSVPLSDYYALAKEGSVRLSLAHGGIWLLGLFGIGFVTKRSVKAEKLRNYDIQELKQTETALSESELWMKSIYNSLNEAVLVVSPDREILNVNNATVDMFGYSAEEISDSSTELLHVDHQHYVEFGERINLAFGEGKVAKFEFEAKRKSGEIFSTEHTVTLLKSPDGDVKGIVSVIRDITERKKNEIELQKYRYQLEGLVEERTTELMKSLAEKEVLLKEVHHRVKNNMAMVSAFIQLQMNGARDSYSLSALGACENRIHAMSMVHKRLYQSSDFTNIDMNILFDEISGALFKKSDFDNIELDIQTNDICLEVDAAIPCAMIINELLSNSLKYAFTDGQPGKISINMDVIKDGVYCLRVSDTGVGLSGDVSIGEADTLGLQLVDVFVGQLNGKLEVLRKDGVTFKIVFPVGKTTNV